MISRTFQCPKCKSWNTEEKNKKGICWECNSFFEMTHLPLEDLNNEQYN